MIDNDDHSSSTDDALASLIRAAAPTSFAPGFPERVADRVRADGSAMFSEALERQVRRVVPFVAAASLILAAYNWWGARGTSSSAIDAALNLPRVTLSAAYTPSSLYGDVTNSVGTP
jgi:hypothetical protein